MRNFLLFLLLVVAPLSYAQTTTVTATVVDPNNNPYALGTVSAQTVVASGQATKSTTPSALDSLGSFSIVLPSPNTYIFTFCAPPVNIGPLANVTPQQVCFQSGPTAVSGGSVDISSTVNPLAKVIGPKPSTSGTVITVSASAPLASSGGATPNISVNSNGITATQLATQYSKLSCSPGIGDGLNAIPAGTYLQFNCVNKSGVTWTIAGVNCWTDNAGSSTLNLANNAATGLLTGAVTCNNTKSGGGAAGTQSATVTLANNDAISFMFVADGTSKQTTWTVSLTQ